MIDREILLKNINIHKFDEYSVSIIGDNVSFFYQVADSVVKPEFKGQYRYFGGLQCIFKEGTEEYREAEQTMCEIAENNLKEK